MISRRGFLAGGAAAAAGAAGLTAAPGRAAAPAAEVAPNRIPFDGLHQSGITTPVAAQATVAALDVIAPGRAALQQGLEALTSRARDLTQGSKVFTLEYDEPPSDSGTLGVDIPTDTLTVTIGFGRSLFDDRYGLKAPAGLSRMPEFPDDAIDPARSHGDLSLQVSARHRDTVVHTLRELMRPVRDAFVLRWAIDGFQSVPRGTSARNLFGFPDGTGNPKGAERDALVWNADGSTFQVVRTIRMHVEFWDRVGLREQEQMIGRKRDTGAPLGGTREFQDPRYDEDPDGVRIPLDAHIRLANPRRPQTEDQRILRRGYNYHRGFDEAGQLDQGLVFVAYNRDIERQFATIQKRLAGEPMVDYITTVGGGYFYVPRGARGPGDHVGSALFS